MYLEIVLVFDGSCCRVVGGGSVLVIQYATVVQKVPALITDVSVELFLEILFRKHYFSCFLLDVFRNRFSI